MNIKQLILLSFLSLNLSGQSYEIQGKDTIYRVNGKTYIIINGDSFHYLENHKIIGSRVPKVKSYGMRYPYTTNVNPSWKSGNPPRRTNYSSSSSCCSPSKSDVYVQGYYRKDGTYVRPHMRSAPNGTKRDNFSYKGNTNPYRKNN